MKHVVRLPLLLALALLPACQDGDSSGGTGDDTDVPFQTIDPVETCFNTELSFQRVDDWEGTGLTVEVHTPFNWSPAEHPTWLFGHGNNFHPADYHCYREELAESCIRTVSPELWNSNDHPDDEHLGWNQRKDRWAITKQVHQVLESQQSTDLIFVGGHSMGAYTALQATGANSWIGSNHADNCDPYGDCAPLPAAGYIMLSAWPAQSAQSDPPFWFCETAFEDLEPNRYLAYGEFDDSSGDPCLDEQPPVCRGDSYSIDEDAAEELNLRLDVLDEWEHNDFACSEDWAEEHFDPEGMAELIERIGDWMQSTLGG